MLLLTALLCSPHLCTSAVTALTTVPFSHHLHPSLSPAFPDLPWFYGSKDRKNIFLFALRPSLIPRPVPGQGAGGAQLLPCSPGAEQAATEPSEHLSAKSNKPCASCSSAKAGKTFMQIAARTFPAFPSNLISSQRRTLQFINETSASIFNQDKNECHSFFGTAESLSLKT